jgi:hypothetical protein
MRHGYFSILGMVMTLLLFTGCASAPQHLTEQNAGSIKNIAVVSLVPEQVNFDKIGIISLSNKYTEFDLAGKVTENILYVSRERIAKIHPGWTIKDVEYDRAALLDQVKAGYGFGSSATRNAFTELARNNDLDAVVVVRAAADPPSDSDMGEYELREGLGVLLKDNNISDGPRIELRANLSVTVLGKNGEVLAAATAPAKLDNQQALRPAEYDVGGDMKHNHRPEILHRLVPEVVADLAGRLNYCFDSLGFVGDSDTASYHVEIAPQPAVAGDSDATSPSQSAPVIDSFDQCFSRCRQYTDRTKEQCFDVCNK